MIDAYTIGIKLALEDGVSAAIAAIRQDLATLDRAVAGTAAGLIALRRLGQQVSLVTRDDAQPAPPSVPSAPPPRAAVAPTPLMAPSADTSLPNPIPNAPDLRVFPNIDHHPAAPRSSDTPPPPRLPQSQPSTTGIRAPLAPIPNRHPAILPDQSRPRSASEFAPALTPVSALIDGGPPSVQSPVNPAPAALNTVAQAPTPASSIGSAAGPARSNSAAPRRDSAVAPQSPRPAPRAWSDYAASTHDRSDPALPPRTRPDHEARRPSRSGHAPPAAEPAPRRTHIPASADVAPRAAWADPAPRNAGFDDGGAAPSRSAPPGRDEAQSAGFSGDIVMEGTRLGRWMTDGLTRMTERPPSGSTGVDPRSTPGWPGMHGD